MFFLVFNPNTLPSNFFRQFDEISTFGKLFLISLLHSVVISLFYPHMMFFAKISSNQRTKAKYYKNTFTKSLISPIWRLLANLCPKGVLLYTYFTKKNFYLTPLMQVDA